MKELKRQVVKHPSIVSTDFDISREGKLLLHVSPSATHPSGIDDSRNNNQDSDRLGYRVIIIYFTILQTVLDYSTMNTRHFESCLYSLYYLYL